MAKRDNAGRKGRQYENDMEAYRKWFTTGNVRTRYRNATKLKKFCDWIGKTPEQLIAEYAEARKDVNTYNQWKRETRKKIVEFYDWLKASGYRVNTARTQPLGILRFYSDHCETVKGVTKHFDAVQIPRNEYVFTQDDLRARARFLTPEAIDSLNDYLEILEKKHGHLPRYLWSSNSGDAHLTNQG